MDTVALLIPGFFARLQIECVHFEPFALRPTDVHAQQHLSPVL